MNRKSEERRKAAKTRRRREERCRARWESYPQRILRLVDEDLPFDQMADRVSMEVLRARPSPEDGQELLKEIRRMMGRAAAMPEVLPGVFAAVDAVVRINLEIEMLKYALIETVELLGSGFSRD